MKKRKENAMYIAVPGKKVFALHGDLTPESWAEGQTALHQKKTQRKDTAHNEG
jgi:hypothetical protein